MSTLLKGAAAALTLAAICLTAAAPAAARDAYTNRHGAVSFSLGNVAFGYRDGYWDNDHAWHKWRNNRDYRSYRGHQGGSFHNWNHNRDADHGWQR